MPNHVANILTIKGTTKETKEVLNILLNEDNGVTFDNFAPMPEELRGTTSPTKIVSQKEYDDAKKELEEKLASGEKVWNTSLPITAEMQDVFITKYGSDNWYDWAVENWGTKWGAYDGYAINDTTIFFNTAWSTPVNAIITLSNQFPTMSFNVKYADEDFGHNVGEYEVQDGILIIENVPEGGSIEAYEMALDIQGGEDYYLGDNIYEMSEDEIEEDYYNKFLKLIIKKEMVDENYPSFVNQYLLEQAVENEQFEYASQLRDAMKVKN